MCRVVVRVVVGKGVGGYIKVEAQKKFNSQVCCLLIALAMSVLY